MSEKQKTQKKKEKKHGYKTFLILLLKPIKTHGHQAGVKLNPKEQGTKSWSTLGVSGD